MAFYKLGCFILGPILSLSVGLLSLLGYNTQSLLCHTMEMTNGIGLKEL